MTRYIDADRFEKEQAYFRAHLIYKDGTSCLGYYAVLTSVQIKDAPTEDVAPVTHAHWTYEIDDLFPADSMMICSNCGEYERLGANDNYCGNCGAKMDEEV